VNGLSNVRSLLAPAVGFRAFPFEPTRWLSNNADKPDYAIRSRIIAKALGLLAPRYVLLAARGFCNWGLLAQCKLFGFPCLKFAMDSSMHAREIPSPK
jgi:hypothetical protein